MLSVLPAELPAAVEKMQQEMKDLRKAHARLQEQLAVHHADRLVAAAPEQNGRRVVAEIVSGFDAQALKVMAAPRWRPAGRTVVALVSASNPALVAVARSPDTAGDAGALLRKVIEQFGGKGGGKPDLAQGNLNGEPAAVLDALRTLIA